MPADTRCDVLGGENFCMSCLSWHNIDLKDLVAQQGPLGQNDRQLKLYILIDFVGPSH